MGGLDLPSAFSITLGLFPSMIATQELVVPKSIPITLRQCTLDINDTYAKFLLAWWMI